MNKADLLPDSDRLPVIDDFTQLLINDTPLLDTRAPIEFQAGAIPQAHNYALMNDAEREQIGKRYKQAGQDEAIVLGLKLVADETKAARIAAWQDFFQRYPQGALYCFRGGLRSKITQQWLYTQTGIAYPRVQGGYKALRQFLLQQLESLPKQFQAYVLTGRTGSGKTELLKKIANSVDLEGLAHHRGSAFGPQLTPQPTQIDFENRLAVSLLKQVHRGYQQLWFEDESSNIGSVHVPATLMGTLRQAPLVWVESTLAERIECSYREYISEQWLDYVQHYGEEEPAFSAFSAYLLASLAKLQKRLGGVRYQAVFKQVEQALALQAKTGEQYLHAVWIESLLSDYYDPMYDYQIQQKQGRVVFKGDHAAVLAYIASLS